MSKIHRLLKQKQKEKDQKRETFFEQQFIFSPFQFLLFSRYTFVSQAPPSTFHAFPGQV